MEYYITGGLAIVGRFVKQQNLVECVQRIFTAGQVISPFFRDFLARGIQQQSHVCQQSTFNVNRSTAAVYLHSLFHGVLVYGRMMPLRHLQSPSDHQYAIWLGYLFILGQSLLALSSVIPADERGLFTK